MTCFAVIFGKNKENTDEFIKEFGHIKYDGSLTHLGSIVGISKLAINCGGAENPFVLLPVKDGKLVATSWDMNWTESCPKSIWADPFDTELKNCIFLSESSRHGPLWRFRTMLGLPQPRPKMMHKEIKAFDGYRWLDENETIMPGDFWIYTNQDNPKVYKIASPEEIAVIEDMAVEDLDDDKICTGRTVAEWFEMNLETEPQAWPHRLIETEQPPDKKFTLKKRLPFPMNKYHSEPSPLP